MWIEVPIIVALKDDSDEEYEVSGNLSVDKILYYFPDADYEYTIVRVNGENLQVKMQYGKFKRLLKDAKE